MSPLVESAAPFSVGAGLRTEPARCCICGRDDGHLVARGRDFEYDTAPDEFEARECAACRVVYLDPRPSDDELSRIYPASYHAFDFSPAEFGFVYRVRERLEARRVLGWCRGLPSDARILDIGCGDGFHLDLLRRYGEPSWQLEGIDSDSRAVAAAARRGLTVHLGRVEDLPLPKASYHLILLIMTIEHVADPANLLAAARELLLPGGRIIVITDNTDSIDRFFARKRYWGGYHFQRHWTLFNPASMRRLASAVQLDVASLTSVLSPVNWVYSIRNWLVDRRAPSWMVERFSLKAPVSLALFTMIDQVCVWLGRGAIFRAELRRPNTESIT